MAKISKSHQRSRMSPPITAPAANNNVCVISTWDQEVVSSKPGHLHYNDVKLRTY